MYLVLRKIVIKNSISAVRMSDYIYASHDDTSKTFTVAPRGGKQGIISVWA